LKIERQAVHLHNAGTAYKPKNAQFLPSRAVLLTVQLTARRQKLLDLGWLITTM